MHSSTENLYGVALWRPEHNDWINVDWGLTLQMAYRFLRLLSDHPPQNWREYAPDTVPLD